MSTRAWDDEIDALIGAYVFDALTDDERRFFERHLSGNSQLRDEVESLRDATVVLAEAQAEAPPPALRSRLLEEIERTPQEPLPAQRRDPAAPGHHARASQGRRWLQAVAAIAVLGVIGLGVALAGARSTVGDLEEQLAAAMSTVDDLEDRVAAAEREPLVVELLQAPDTNIAQLDAPEGVEARLVWSPERNDGVFLAQGLDEAPPGQVYALWLIDDEGPALAETVRPGADGMVQVGIDEIDEAETFGVTLEPEGDIESPTTDILISGPLA